MTKKVLITGIRGQDGMYLAELLRSQNHKVIGTSHQWSGSLHLSQAGTSVTVEKIDITNPTEVNELLAAYKPDAIYNLAARSSSTQFFDDPLKITSINALPALHFLDAIHKNLPNTRFFQAASSEMFAGTDTSPQNERVKLAPLNAYGAAKAFAMHLCSAYRSRHNIFACTAILFNHESPRRGIDYVTRKITKSVAEISLGLRTDLVLGNLESRRDWGHASDTVRAMWLMMQQDAPDDYVLATGKTHSVKEFCQIAFDHVGLDATKYIKTSIDSNRRPELIELCGDARKAEEKLGWKPQVSFEQLVCEMMDADIAVLKSQKY